MWGIVPVNSSGLGGLCHCPVERRQNGQENFWFQVTEKLWPHLKRGQLGCPCHQRCHQLLQREGQVDGDQAGKWGQDHHPPLHTKFLIIIQSPGTEFKVDIFESLRNWSPILIMSLLMQVPSQLPLLGFSMNKNLHLELLWTLNCLPNRIGQLGSVFTVTRKQVWTIWQCSRNTQRRHASLSVESRTHIRGPDASHGTTLCQRVWWGTHLYEFEIK